MVKKTPLKREITNILVNLFQERGIDLNKIVIFGSWAKNTQKKDSDIDLIIVSKNFRNKGLFERVKLVRGVGRELVKKTGKPFDIMYYSDKEWENGNSLIINAAKEEGKVIFG
ncbi:MAG: nucleotidyltransferase domain-containing protein [Proteobacteria bacterium]|nr:nucleotidyltransferase domain-containing protein [Pseudomonadota bacterium]